MNSKTYKTVAVITVLALVFSYIIYQAVAFSKSEIQTQIALKETVYETINTKCFVLRDEKYIKNSTEGTVVSFAKNGERVAAGDTVSMIFSNTEDADTYLKISELKKDISHFETLSGQANLQVLDISSLNSKSNKELTEYLESVDVCDYSAAEGYAELFRSSLTSKQVAMGMSVDYSETLAKLREELASLQNKKLSYTNVKSDASGYYIAGADGYENTLDFSKIDSLTADDVKKAITSSPKSVPSDVAGRSVSDFHWYILCVVDSDKAINIKNDSDLSVNFPYSGIENLPVEVYKIGDRNEKETLLILSCELMNSDLTGFRIEDVEIVTQAYSGFRIKNTAIRTVDGETGVYVVSGNLLGFRKIHIVFATDEYSIVDNPESESGYIKLYDKVVTKGVELYDDKLIGG